jgi:hypothetical protein
MLNSPIALADIPKPSPTNLPRNRASDSGIWFLISLWQIYQRAASAFSLRDDAKRWNELITKASRGTIEEGKLFGRQAGVDRGFPEKG